MRGLLFVVLSFGVTVCAWGVYGPVLHWGQGEMAGEGIKYARLRPFICVGLAYFLIGVIVPAVLLKARGEAGRWTMSGVSQSMLAGALGAIGALGIIMALSFGGKPLYVMPLVFGGAPVVNSFLTIYMAGKFKQVGPLFLSGLVMVLIGAVTVLVFKPEAGKPAVAQAAAGQAAADKPAEGIADEVEAGVKEAGVSLGRFGLQLLSIATVIVCWGAYGPALHKGQAAMQQSRLRPLICVGLAYFAIAVVVPAVLLAGPMPEASAFNISGSFWSLMAGAAGAVGALGIIMAFNFGGKPVYVMPLVFGGAPVVNTIFTATQTGAFTEVQPVRLALFLAGLMITIAGAAMTLVFAPKGPPPKKASGKTAGEAATGEVAKGEAAADGDAAEPPKAGAAGKPMPQPESPKPGIPVPDATPPAAGAATGQDA
ncbi:MAG: hypothetical protein AAF790_08920 [Planctomycetota bacterium]